MAITVCTYGTLLHMMQLSCCPSSGSGHVSCSVITLTSAIVQDCSEASIWERNLALIRNAKRVQDELKLSFHRILYILPQRGPLRRIDEYLIGELDLFYSYFGRVIFDNMIVIVTNDPSYQKTGFSESDLKTTTDVLCAALEKVWTKNKNAYSDDPKQPNCPPVLYLPLDISTQDLLTKIKDTPVSMGTSSATLTIAPNMCTKCGWSVIRVNECSATFSKVGLDALAIVKEVCTPCPGHEFALRQLPAKVASLEKRLQDFVEKTESALTNVLSASHVAATSAVQSQCTPRGK
ncbi:hypothetical protein EMCRGX_G019388 [Ephydatia muelleri]